MPLGCLGMLWDALGCFGDAFGSWDGLEESFGTFCVFWFGWFWVVGSYGFRVG